MLLIIYIQPPRTLTSRPSLLKGSPPRNRRRFHRLFIAVTFRSCSMQANKRDSDRGFSVVVAVVEPSQQLAASQPSREVRPSDRVPSLRRTRRGSCKLHRTLLHHQPCPITQQYCSLKTRAERLLWSPLAFPRYIILHNAYTAQVFAAIGKWVQGFYQSFRFRGPGWFILTRIASHGWEARWLL